MDKPEGHVYRQQLDSEAEVVDAGRLPLKVIKELPFLKTCRLPAHLQECISLEVLQLAAKPTAQGSMIVFAHGTCGVPCPSWHMFLPLPVLCKPGFCAGLWSLQSFPRLKEIVLTEETSARTLRQLLLTCHPCLQTISLAVFVSHCSNRGWIVGTGTHITHSHLCCRTSGWTWNCQLDAALPCDGEGRRGL